MAADYMQRLVQPMTRLARAMLRQAKLLQLSQTAGSLAFLSLLAIAPMFSIVFWVTTASPMFGRLRGALQGFLQGNLFPATISDTVIRLLNQFAAKANELSVIGLAAFLLTAFVALQTIERTLNRIWLADRPRPLGGRLALYWMMLTLGPLLVGASLVLNGVFAAAWLRGADLREVRSLWYLVLPSAITTVALMLLYRLLPSAQVRWREAFAGAVLAAVLIAVLRSLVGLYVSRLPTYTVVYGTFSVLPLLLLWLFLAWMSVLIGALLAANLRFWGLPGEPHLTRSPAARFADAYAVLSTMCREIGANAFAAMPVERVAEALGRDAERAAQAAIVLTRLDYITRFRVLGDARAPAQGRGAVSARVARSVARRRGARRPARDAIWSERWAWSGDPRAMTARALFEAVWHDGRAGQGEPLQLACIDAALVQAQACAGETAPLRTEAGR